jgi:hypothetical protein
MQVVPIETRELTTSATQLRQGVIKAYRLIEGEPGLGNFALRLVNIAGDFLSPRHRHNFDQFRMQLEGTYDYGPDGKFTPPGTCCCSSRVRAAPATPRKRRATARPTN